MSNVIETCKSMIKNKFRRAVIFGEWGQQNGVGEDVQGVLTLPKLSFDNAG